jgi:hypothetical protein
MTAPNVEDAMSDVKNWYTITSNCLCEDYNEDTDTSTPSQTCWGYCWEEQLELFTDVTKDFFDGWKHDYVINGFPTWQGGRGGTIVASTAKELIETLVNRIGDWRAEYIMDGKDLLITLWHHDAPTGGTMRIEQHPWSE